MSEDLTIQMLKTIPLFNGMRESKLKLIAEQSHFIDLGKKVFIFHKGDSCRGFYITIRGNIKISFISKEGKEHVGRIVGPGQSFGEALLFLDKPSPATVQTITPAKLLFIPKKVLFYCIDEDPDCAHKMLAGLSRRIHQQIAEMESLTLDSSQQRVVGYLLQQLQPEGARYSKRNIVLPANKATIALHLNMAPETLSRILHQLNDKNLIQMEGKTIRILDIEKLRNYY